ncbi:MAG: hypothetical protein JXB33_10660 [Clostridia bacterium]|nr:hypothetical protein [Clostridia bacterium]
MEKEKKKSGGVFWKIVISAVGAALILIAAVSLLLFIFGNKAVADVSIRRIGGADDGRPYEQRYLWSVDYTFMDNEGVLRQGHTQKRGGDMAVDTDDTVRYFEFAPFVNMLESETEPGFGQLIYIGLGLLLILAMNGKKKKRKSPHKAVRRPDGSIDVPALDDYDDSVEEVCHEKTTD